MSQYLSAIMLSVFWSQQPNSSYCAQNSRCHWGLKGGSKSRHWGWAGTGWTRTSIITDKIKTNSWKIEVFADVLWLATARKNAQPSPLGWSAALHVLVIFTVCPQKCSAAVPYMSHSVSVCSCTWLCVLHVRKSIKQDVHLYSKMKMLHLAGFVS